MYDVKADEKIITPDTSSIYDDVKDFSKKDNIFSKLVKSILKVENDSNNIHIPFDTDKNIIKKFSGKIVRTIEVVVLDVFGGSIENPEDTTRGWLEDIGNSLHINSKKWLIKNMLIFSKGDVITVYKINESERIIRQFPYNYDVRIIPKLIHNIVDSIDIIVYVQDIWSINGGGAINFGDKSASLYFDDMNFLGFGNQFNIGIKIDRKFINDWDWDGKYVINNIGNSFISAKLLYESEYNHQHFGLILSRDFISPVIKWGGGFAQHWQHNRYPDTIFTPKFARYNQQDYWLGYAFNINPNDTFSQKYKSINIAARITRTVFSQIPIYDSLNLFQNNTFYLGRIGYSDIIFYTDKYIFGLGRTEDVPILKMIEFLFGYETGDNYDSPYIGIKSGYSYLTKDNGYIYCGIQSGTFFRDSELNNFTSNIEFMYFSKLNFIANWKWRHYIGSRFSFIYNPIRPTDMLNINEKNGIRGFTEDYLEGNKKLIVNYEANFFVPITVLGFKLAIIAFTDLGLITTNNNTLFSSKLYQGYGVGIRLKNEHLIFPTMQFMFGYYPNNEQTSDGKFNLFYQSEMYYRFNKFQFSIPSTISVE